LNFGQTALIGVITLVAGFFFGRLSSWLADRREISKERLNSLYVPFEILYDKTHCTAAYNFTDLSAEAQERFIVLLMDKMVYAGDYLRKNIQVLMMNYYDYKTSSDNDNAKKYLNQSFNTVAAVMDEEWIFLRNKLYWSRIDKHRYKKRVKNIKNNIIMRNSNDIFYIS